MLATRHAWLAAGCLVALSLAALPAEAQARSCGDIKLVFRNPDLQPASDGIIHASGQFFAQFQAIGAGADQIKTFGFSFGPDTTSFDEGACAQQPWVTGTYVPNYRADRDAADGFFIPLQTPLVPDGAYAAAVHAYDASDNELARFWARAIVDNCDGGEGTRCDGDLEQVRRQDGIAPWPMVLPGDGAKPEGHEMTFEFGEELASLVVTLNAQNVTDQLTEIEPRVWDADLTPDYGPSGSAGLIAPPCSQPAPVQTCEVYGPAYALDIRPLTLDDVVRVEATDMAGNKAVKAIHLGSAANGGAITAEAPILSYTVDRTAATTPAGSLATFRFEITNAGGGTGHPYAEATGPDGWNLTWNPVHVVVDPGATESQELTVEVPAGAGGAATVTAVLKYDQDGVPKELRQDLALTVGGEAPPPTAGVSPTGTPEAGGKDSPAGGALLALALVAALAAVARRRA